MVECVCAFTQSEAEKHFEIIIMIIQFNHLAGHHLFTQCALKYVRTVPKVITSSLSMMQENYTKLDHIHVLCEIYFLACSVLLIINDTLPTGEEEISDYNLFDLI